MRRYLGWPSTSRNILIFLALYCKWEQIHQHSVLFSQKYHKITCKSRIFRVYGSQINPHYIWYRDLNATHIPDAFHFSCIILQSIYNPSQFSNSFQSKKRLLYSLISFIQLMKSGLDQQTAVIWIAILLYEIYDISQNLTQKLD